MRFGLVGTGHWAREVHGAALAAHPAVDLVGVWGRASAKTAREPRHGNALLRPGQPGRAAGMDVDHPGGDGGLHYGPDQ